MSLSHLCYLLLLTLAVLGKGAKGQSNSEVVEQCKKSDLRMDPNVQLVPPQDYYPPNTEVSVRCKEGYKPSRDTIKCKVELDKSVWNVTDIHCVAFQVTVTRVTPTSISLQWECEPGPCQSHWLFIDVYYEAVGQKSGSTQTFFLTQKLTLNELQSYTEYNFTISGHRGNNWTELWRRTIRTEESAPGKPHFTQYPTINNNKNILKWRLSETHGVLTGYQLNISAQREYDLSFNKTESHWLRPNVTEFNLELKHGTNYTVTLQGFTSVGPGEPAVWTLETPIVVPGKPDQYYNNNTLKWRLSDTRIPLTGYQLHMVAWKENIMIEEESHLLPPNVTEYRIPMEANASYMVTVRGLTATGPGEASVWLSGNLKAAGASDTYVRVSLVLKPLFLIILILVLLCFTVKEKWEQKRTGEKRHQRRTERGGSIEMVPPVRLFY